MSHLRDTDIPCYFDDVIEPDDRISVNNTQGENPVGIIRSIFFGVDSHKSWGIYVSIEDYVDGDIKIFKAEVILGLLKEGEIWKVGLEELAKRLRNKT